MIERGKEFKKGMFICFLKLFKESDPTVSKKFNFIKNYALNQTFQKRCYTRFFKGTECESKFSNTTARGILMNGLSPKSKVLIC